MRSFLPLALLALACLALLPACGDKDDGGKDGGSHAEPAGSGAGTGGNGPAEDTGSALDDQLGKRVAEALAKGRTFLLTQQQDNGGFTDRGTEQMRENVAFTAMGISALVASAPTTGVSDDAKVLKALEFLKGFQQENGAIVDNPKHTNYGTSASISALAHAKVGAFRGVQSKAMAYLEASQIVADNDKTKGSVGGFPYKDEQSADGSNAFIAVNALDAGGLAKDSAVRKRVGEFASGLQNRDESNKMRVVVKTGEGDERTVVAAGDGGAFYRVGESKAGLVKRSDGTYELKSYGSMTYAILKLMLFAGIPATDPRVEALVGWISRHWTVERNPGFEHQEDAESAGQQGYFYYLYTVARALSAYETATGKPLVVRDADGRKHNWREEVAKALLDRQDADGSWQNKQDRWMEGMKTLATAFAMQTLGVLNGRLD